MKFSSLTNKEYFNLHGELSEERQRDLVDAEEDFKKTANTLEHAKDAITEIIGIAEDYMADYSDDLASIHAELTTLKNKLRGPDNKALIKIIGDLELYQHSMSNSYEFMVQEGRL